MTTHIPELAIASLLLASITRWITNEDWSRAIGPHGGLFVSIVMLIVFILFARSRVKKDDVRAEKDQVERERRHQESMAAQAAVADKFEGLTERVMDVQLETAKALMKLTHSNESLHTEMRLRPCQMRREPQDESTTV